MKNLKISYLGDAGDVLGPKPLLTATPGLTELSREVALHRVRPLTGMGPVVEDDDFMIDGHKVIYFEVVKLSALHDVINFERTFKMKHEINLGDLIVSFRFLLKGTIKLRVSCRDDDTRITIRIKRISEVLEISKPEWGFPQASQVHVIPCLLGEERLLWHAVN